MTYKKRIIDAEGNFVIMLHYGNGKVQEVSKDQDLYQKWLDKGNEPEVIPFVAPAKPKAITVAKLKEKAIALAEDKKRMEYEERLWNESAEKKALEAEVVQIRSKNKADLITYIEGTK